jgi:hypothetical protein
LGEIDFVAKGLSIDFKGLFLKLEFMGDVSRYRMHCSEQQMIAIHK